MSEGTITCPKCQTEIEVTEVIKAQLGQSIRQEMEAELDAARQKLKDDQAKIEAERKQLGEQAENIDAQVRQKLDEEREVVQAKARKQAEEALAVELKDRDEQLNEAKTQLKAAQDKEIASRKKQRELEKRETEIEKEKEELQEQLQEQFAKEKQKLIEQAKQKAREDLDVELKDRDDELATLRDKVKKSAETELEMRKRERKLQERAEKMELEVTRKLDEEREKVRATALKQADEEHQLKVKEKDQQLEVMRKQIDELKRKAEQGSQQTQGEVMEIELEKLLGDLFPTDRIEPVPKGVKGGDVLQRVHDVNGMECGTILWESKRTKNWSDKWLAKLRDDQREARATCAALVSIVLPDDIRHFGHKDSIWVSEWSCVHGAAAALRTGLISAARSKRALEGQQGKMALVYNYLASPEFFNRVSGIFESFKTMKDDLDGEKRAFQRQWSKREKQLDRALVNTAGLYGDLQGIIGSSLKEIDGMSLPAPEANESTPRKALTAG